MSALAGAVPFYRRLASPLHAARAPVGAAWTLALVTATLLIDSPVVLAALLAGLVVAALGARVSEPLLNALRGAVLVAVPIVLVNVLVSRRGITVFARLGDLGPFGQGDLTVEALVYGALIALKVTLVILIVALASLAVDPDELLHALRRVSFRSALTASIAMRMLPLLAADAQRLSEAQRTRPDAPTGRARGRLAILAAIIGGSLDRAMDVAATLEVRGFACPARPPRAGRRQAERVRIAASRHDIAFAASAAAIAALALGGRLSGAGAFSAYPTIHTTLGPPVFFLAAALAAAVISPFAARRGTAG